MDVILPSLVRQKVQKDRKRRLLALDQRNIGWVARELKRRAFWFQEIQNNWLEVGTGNIIYGLLKMELTNSTRPVHKTMSNIVDYNMEERPWPVFIY